MAKKLRARAKSGRKATGRTRPKKSTAARRGAARAKSSRARRAQAARATARSAAKRRTATKRAPSRKAAPRAAARRTARGAKKKTASRRAPAALTRERRVLREEEMVPTPPSSLDLDRSASAVRSGRKELQEHLNEHTETGPALTGGDVDASWESAYSTGDEAPGGDNPTPDQDRVDDIGKSLGVQYQDNEELRSSDKIADRDKKRWELDPASAEDYRDRNKR